MVEKAVQGAVFARRLAEPCGGTCMFYVYSPQDTHETLHQRDAYYHPTVDHSDEPFKWGLPDLDALREYVA